MLVTQGLPPPQPAFEIRLASRGISQGIAQTSGTQVVPRLFVRIGGAQIGGQWKNISSDAASGVAATFLGFTRQLHMYRLDARAAYRVRTAAKGPSDADAWEFAVGMTRDLGKSRLRARAEYSPDDFGRGESLFVELGSTLDIGKRTTLSVNVGRRQRDGGPDYTAFNVGFEQVIRRGLSIDTRYYDTDRSGLGDSYRGRIVVSAQWAL